MFNLYRWLNITVDELDKFNRDMGLYLQGVLLDIGCGEQKRFFDKVDRHIGLDYPGAIRINSQLSAFDTDVFGDALSLPFKDGSFDCAVALTVFEHLKNPFIAAKEANRILKKRGIFAITVPFTHRMHSDPYDFYRFTTYGLRHILESAGFEVLEIKNGGGMWKAIAARLSGYIYSDILGLGYGVDDLNVRPKKYLLPIFAPLIFIIVLIGRILDKLHYVDKDSLVYYALCRKR